MSAWSRAWRGLAMARTPARIAAFKLATRNLSNQLGVPVERILEAAQQHADNDDSNYNSAAVTGR
jgi:hypothetical protein